MRDQLGSAAGPDDFTTACASDVDLYLHPLLEDPPVASRVDAATYATYERLVERAHAACSRCPILAACLYKAVVQADVSGYVGCTTPKERVAMRRLLGVKLEPEDLDAVAGARVRRQPVDHEAVMAMRAAYPDDPLEQIANRLGCSLSTVKRHMRRARRAEASRADAEPEALAALPTLDEVFDGFDEVVEANRPT